MTTKIYDVTRGSVIDVAPKIFHGGQLKPVSSWVYRDGLWRKSYDPREVNLIANSRMIGGTDMYAQDGVKIGYAPPTWTVTNTANNNSSATFIHDDVEYSRKYKIETIENSIFMSTRISCVENQIYYASFLLDDISQLPDDHYAKLFVENVSNALQSLYIEIIEPFERIGETNRVGCQFLIKQNCVLKFSIGVGIDYVDTGSFTFSEPQINRNPFLVNYAPTPVYIDYNAVDFDGGFVSHDDIIRSGNGYSWIDFSLQLHKHQTLVLVSRWEDSIYSGIQIDTINNKLQFVKNNEIVKQEDLAKSISIDQLMRLSLQIVVSSDYISEVTVLINNEIVVRSSELMLGMTNSFNRVIGNENVLCELILEQFNLHINDITRTFNVEEGEGNIINDRTGQLSFNLGGVFNWLDRRSPIIVY